jgi:NhaA family Na+:H+ antiporter
VTKELRTGAVVLLAATVLALLWANSPWSGGYESLAGSGLRGFVDEGLMSVFFLVVGLEIRREWREGELTDPRAAALPAVAALGGMVVPALVYLAVNHGGATAGWGIPMATDIAFSLAVLALLGPKVPPPLKVFLLTLAVVDDVGAIAVIAVVYTDSLEPLWLAAGAAAVSVAVVLRFARVRAAPVWVVVAVALWWCAHEAGISPTLAGVAVALLAPVGPKLERALIPWTNYLIVPLFALVNAGVALDGSRLLSFEPVTVGVFAGLVLGKTLGISVASWVAARLRLGRLPRDTTWPQLTGAASVAGIGFTVSLFVTGLAFDDAALRADATVGILAGSLVAALIGSAVLARVAHS